MFKVIFLNFLLVVFFNESTIHAEMIETNTNQPYTYEMLENDLLTLKAKYKDNIELRTIGTTYFGRNISAIKVGEGKACVLFVGSHHAREWMTSMILINMAEKYASGFSNKTTHIPQDISIWFVPMLNPDGVTIQQNQIHLFPPEYQNYLLFLNEGWDNYIRWKANGKGIDLNRQYPAGWKALEKKDYSPSYQYFKGKKPLEAEEVIALTKFVKEINPLIAVSYHSAGREIFWKYKNGENVKRDRGIAKKVAKQTGYKLGKPPKEAVGGGFTDWFITTYHRPALTIEISYLVGDRHPPLKVFKEEWKRNENVGLLIAREALKLQSRDR
ncbi:MAG: M14 family zinc carboxypeptidase [Bacillota bacterium]|nr:M14 family zinc carboxypeptidase [Bacillota bacterium]